MRFFRKKSPLFEASHRYTLPKTRSVTGLPQRSEKLYDPDRLQKLQKLVNDHSYLPGLSLADSVKKLAKTDLEFNDFLKTFKSKDEPEWNSLLDSPASLDIKSYLKDPKRSAQDRLDELHMHDQLRKKLISEKLYAQHIKNQDKHEYRATELDQDSHYRPLHTMRTRADVRNRDVGDNVFLSTKNFHIMFIDAGSTTNITKLSRVNHRHVLLYMGNCDGIISYGRGKGISYQMAYDDAVDQCKRNMICINLDHYMTTPGYLSGHFNDTTVRIWAAPQGMSWGHILYYNILALAGLNGFTFKLYSRNVNKYAIIYCFFKCFVKNMTPRQISQQRGVKIYQMTYGRSLRRDYKSSLFSV